MGKVIRLEKSPFGSTKLSSSLVEAVDALPCGKYVILIEKQGFARTMSQNRLFWMWMAQLEYWSGTPRRVWHDHYVALFIPPNKHGTSDLSTEAMKHFMNQIHADALTEWGVNLPLPEEDEENNETFYDFVDEFKFK